MTEKKPSIRSLAGHVLATDDDPEKRRLAAAVLGDDSLTPNTTKSPEDLRRILSRIEGQEGQTERASAVRQALNELEGE